jgi:hypothetical protein
MKGTVTCTLWLTDSYLNSFRCALEGFITRELLSQNKTLLLLPEWLLYIWQSLKLPSQDSHIKQANDI